MLQTFLCVLSNTKAEFPATKGTSLLGAVVDSLVSGEGELVNTSQQPAEWSQSGLLEIVRVSEFSEP